MASSMTPGATKTLLLAPTLREAASHPTTRELFEAHATFVVRVVQRLGVRASDADDVAQEVFMIVHRRIGDLSQPEAARSWLFGIARRVVANHLRKSKRRNVAVDAGNTALSLDDPAEQLELSRERNQLERALSRLDDDKRSVFVLFELEGLEMREVAQLVGCPLNTAYSRLYAARDLVLKYVTSRQNKEAQP